MKAWCKQLAPHIEERFRDNATFDTGVISAAEHSEQALYWLWHAYAGLTGYPTGMIYLLSRISSDLRDGKLDQVKKLAATLRVLANYLDQHSKSLAALTAPNMLDKTANVEDPLQELAYKTVEGYHRDPLPADHVEAGTPYRQSQQCLKDAKQVLILLHLLANVAPPFASGHRR
jgi:hypothetical protein